MAFPIRREEAALGTCDRCGGETHCMNEERVDDLLGIPVMRRYFMWHSRCRSCGVVAARAIPKHDGRMLLPLARARIWFVLSWSLLVMCAVTFGVCWSWNERIEHRHALVPIVGDRWTIVAKDWPENVGAPEKYIRLQVTGVADDSVDVMACPMSYRESDDARNECKTFDLEMESITREKLAMIYDDAFQRVDSERDDGMPLKVGFGICAGLIFVWRIIAGAWKRRVGLVEF